MKYKFFTLIGIILLFIFVVFFWWQQAVKPPNTTDDTHIMFVIDTDESIRNIANRLEKEDLIRSPVAFFLLARFGGIGEKIQAGDFLLKRNMNLYSLANSLTHGTRDVKITIIEGWRNEEIALILAQELDIPESEFIKEAKIGYMFPDTYLIPQYASASAVVKILLDNFNTKVKEDILSKARKKGLTIDELIILASLVEREAKLDEDRPLVASVILNRLSLGMKLDIDATVQYALGYQPQNKSWWKKDLTYDDLELDSPYNTYKNADLPPSPISNPGLESIKAVVDAPDTDYLFYLSDPSGKTHFSETIEEHEVKISKYLRR